MLWCEDSFSCVPACRSEGLLGDATAVPCSAVGRSKLGVVADVDAFCGQVFYGFGVAGLVWVIWWERLVADMAVQEPEVVEQLQKTVPMGASGEATQDTVPWRAFIRNGPLRALAYTHFTNNW